MFTGSLPTAELETSVITDSGEPVDGIEVEIRHQGVTQTYITDHNGKVQVDELPVNCNVDIKSIDKNYNNASVSITTQEGINMVEIKVKKKASASDMKIKVIDDHGEIISNSLIRGEIVLNKVPYGSEVTCTQIINGLGSRRHTFTFTQDNDTYILKGLTILGKAAISDLEIHVQNKKKQNIPNLRVTISDGHKDINRITNENGRVFVNDIPRGKKLYISTEYKNKEFQTEFECSKDKELLKILVGRSPWLFLLWLIPLLAILGFCIWKYLVPIIVDKSNTPVAVVADTTDNNNVQPVTEPQTEPEPEPTVEPEPAPAVETVVEAAKGIALTIIDEESGQPISGAVVDLDCKGSKYNGKSDAQGKISFEQVPSDTTQKVNVKVTCANHDDFLGSFMFTPEKTIVIPKKSLEYSEEILPCGSEIRSKGYHSTVKTFDLKQKKGKVKIYYQMNDVPDQMVIYKGRASQISDKKIIYDTKFVKFSKMITIPFDTDDGLITVKINGGDDSKTQWYVKVNCP